MAIEATCHCKQITIEVDTAPSQVTSCNCSICRRLGTLWAYYPPSSVRIRGATATYRWGDQEIDFHRCTTCGCTTHWAPIAPGGKRMGINSRLMAPEIVAAAKVRYLDGAAGTWVEMPSPTR